MTTNSEDALHVIPKSDRKAAKPCAHGHKVGSIDISKLRTKEDFQAVADALQSPTAFDRK